MTAPGLVASYPRSGSSLVRLIVAHQFQQLTASVYPEYNASQGFQRAVNASGMAPVMKTHEKLSKPCTGRVLVVVRNPRSVFQSLQWFYRDQGSEYSLEELIEGRHPWGDWSAWLVSWMRYAPQALWMRYEDIVGDVDKHARLIGSHFGLGEPQGDLPPFHELQSADARMWRRGQAEPEPLKGADEALIRKLHGPGLRMFGYV